jgi:hypothetical protein
VAGRDITEGRSSRAIAVDVGVVSDTSIWQNTDIAYDIALGGMPFIYAISDQRPYVRQTAPYRKEQFDNQTEPGEQSLTGWWIRSQSSFHDGTGITFYDPALIPGDSTYQFKDSRGVNVWTKGQVTLLRNTATPTGNHPVTGKLKSNGKPFQAVRGIEWSDTNGVLLWDEYDVDKIAVDGTVTHFVDYNSGNDYPVYAICDDGTSAYWVTNQLNAGTPRLRVFSKPLTGTSATTATPMISDNSITVSEGVMEYIKDRIVMAINNKIYEFSSSATSLPSPIYTHSDTDVVFTSITASGTAIYIAAFSGIQSFIYKFTLNTTTGAMPSLTSAITAAEMPEGEKIYSIKYYLGYVLIGTSKGIRVATVDDAGSITYGPLMVETSQPCYDFAFRDRFAWAATGVAGEGGVIRIDLGNDLGGLRFAYANDLWLDNGVTGHRTTGCAFNGDTDRLTFVTTATTSANGTINIESSGALMPDGYIQTGYIRYNTLEPKNFKRLIGRGDFSYGSMTLETVDTNGIEYDLVSYDAAVPPVEVTTSQPAGSQEYLGYKFILYRDATTNTLGPIFKGYQAKATIATPRQRLIKFPVFNYDIETDKYNVMVGYEGRAVARVAQLETIEQNGDVITWQDLQTGESRQVVVEQVTFTRQTPPDRGFSGYGGIIDILIRTV